MNQNILYNARLKRLLVYYITAGVLSACILSGIIILKKYEVSFSDTIKKLQTVKKNFARTGDIIKDMNLSAAAVRVVIPSDFMAKAPEDLIFIGLDDIKSRFGDAEISITNLEYRGEEVSLPVNIKGGMKDYMTLVNNCGYLPSSHFNKKIPFKLHKFLKYAFTGLAVAAFILITVFLFRTLKAHKDMVEYNNLLVSKGEIRMRLLKGSMENAYLKQMGTRFYMDAKLRIGLLSNNMKLVREFAEWSESERPNMPYSFFYVREAAALYAVGLKKKAFDLLDEGLLIYPDKEDILEAKNKLIAGEIKARISSSKIKQ
jgi:hypothetical protein